MKHLLLLPLIVTSATALADCHVRINTTIPQHLINTPPTDIQQIVTPDSRGYKCAMQYRLHVDREWRTVEGIGYGKTEMAACAQAIDTNRGAYLEEAVTSNIHADNQMVCSDLPDIRVRPVKIGESIWESEVELHAAQSLRKPFIYKRTMCRFFTERGVKNNNFYPYQGVICRENMTGNSKWVVVDKF